VLYLLAVVPIALMYGTAVAGAVAVASMAAFTFFFLPPRYSFDLGTSDRWSVLVAFLVAALVVSQLAARSQREARQSARLVDQQARLAEEQAALRPVATLVARGAPPEELFAAVVAEAGRVLPTEHVGMGRYESDGRMTADEISSGLADSFRARRSLAARGQEIGVARLGVATKPPLHTIQRERDEDAPPVRR
jgi:Domain of unknown function (DUF4118)